MIGMKDIALSPVDRKLLMMNGKMDRENGVSLHDGWREVAQEAGYDDHARTPAYEAYADGWHLLEIK